MVFEFEIVTNGADAVAAPNGNTTGTAPGNAFSATNTTTSWTIQDFRVIGDIITLDSALQNSYSEYVLSGKALTIQYNT